MKASKNAHCLIDVNGRDRRLFTMVESADHDLMLSFQTLDVMGDGYGEEHEGKRIKAQKYSVHPSAGSVTKINAITHKATLEDGTVLSGEHYTQAIKQHGRFAYLASVWCPDLDQHKYIPRTRAIKRMRLGSYDPALMTLEYALFVGARGLDFEPTENVDYNYGHMDFHLFRVVVLWSFAHVPSAYAGIKVHGHTRRPEDVPAEDKERYALAVKGCDAMGAVTLYRSIRGTLFSHYLGRVVAEVPEMKDQAAELLSWGFEKTALFNEERRDKA